MVSVVRPSGIEVIGDVPWGTHFCLFYQTRQDIVDVLVPYFKAGLENNEFCMCIASEPFKKAEVKKQMAKAIPGFNKYLKNGQMEILAYDEWYKIDGVFDQDRVLNGWAEKLRRAQECGFSGLRLTGNTFWLEKSGWKGFMDYEDAVNNAIGHQNMIALCTYSLERCDAGDILDVVSTHQFALARREGEWRVVESEGFKETREALRESEERFRAIIHNSSDIIRILDREGRIVFDSPSSEKILGYPAEDTRGKSPLDYVHPGDRERVRDELSRVYTNTNRGIPTEFRIRKANGEYLDVESVCMNMLGVRGVDGVVINTRPITERKRAEEELQETRDYLESLINYANAPIIVWDPGFTITQFNHAFEWLSGYEAGEVVGKNLKILFPPDNIDESLEKIRSTLTGERWESVEIPVLCKDGSTRIALWNSANIYGEHDKLLATIAQGQDITERKQVEEALRMSERNLAKAQSIARLGFWVWDVNEDVLTWSDETYRLLGLRPGEVTPNYVTFMGFVHPEDRENVAKAVQDALEGTRPYKVEWRLLKEDGTVSYLYSQGEVERTNGRPLRMMGTLLDITERKQIEEALRNSERLYRAIGESIDYGVWVCAPDGRNIYASESFLKLVGMTQQQCSDFGWGDVLHPDDAERTMAAWKECVRTGGTWDIEHRYHGVDGKYHPILARGVAVCDEKGEIIYWAGINLDISRIKQSEAALKDAKAQAELYLDLMGHDINNMNHSAMGYLELALQALETEKRLKLDDKVLIERPMRALANSSALIGNVRKLQRLMSDGVKTTPTDLSEILNAIDVQNLHSNDRDVTINIRSEPHYMVEANELLRDVFLNLITNAIKHSDEDKPLTINVKVEPVNENGQKYYRCVVEDNGPGIPDDLKPKLFHRFKRGTTKAHGKGLGLYLVRTLIEGYGGKVWVEDRVPGEHMKGARFVFLLPTIEKQS